MSESQGNLILGNRTSHRDVIKILNDQEKANLCYTGTGFRFCEVDTSIFTTVKIGLNIRHRNEMSLKSVENKTIRKK